MEMVFMNTQNNKTNEPQEFVFNLAQKVYLKSSNSSSKLDKT